MKDTTRSAVDQRIWQQEILSELGVIALQGGTMDVLLTQTVRLVADGLQSEFCKVLEFVQADNCFTVRAGVGWGTDVVGVAQVGADLASPAGFALKTGKPVISNHLGNEQRFRTPELFARYGILRAMNVILQGDGTPFGVLEVDSRSEGDFMEKDIPFLQGAANILGMAIERERRCLSRADSYSAFSLMSPCNRASPMAREVSIRSTVFSRCSSALSCSAPSLVRGNSAMTFK